MKTYKHLMEEIADFDNLYKAYLEARKNKRYRKDVLMFSADLGKCLCAIQNKLLNGTYNVGRYKRFYVYEPKKRLIMALPFTDRVVQWAIYRQLNPIFDKSFIYDSFGCRVGKGTHNAANRLQYWLRQISRHCMETGDKYYYLKLDVKKFFHRVDHAILLELIGKKIKDTEVMVLLDKIVNSKVPFGVSLNMVGDNYIYDDMLTDVGMPIGNLTSQLFANIYLNELDQYCKHELKCHYYIRYMDDIIILANNKRYLHELKTDIEHFLNTKLKLHLNNKTTIRPVSLGIEFVGFKIWATHRYLKKKSVLRITREFRKMMKFYADGYMDVYEVESKVQSYVGIMSHANTFSLRKKIFKWFVLRRSSGKETI